MSQPAGLCRHYRSPGGCRFGDRCKFSHDQGGSAPSRASSSPAASPARSRSQTPLPASPPSRNRAPAGVPRNVCQFFWSTGSCAKNFECNYRHVRQTGVSDPPTDSSQALQGEQELDFFSPDGLAASVGSVREDRYNLNPSEVHNHLRDFTHDRYRFEHAAQIQGFVRILGSVNDGNKNWNTENAQEFLDVVVKGNALHRIGEVLRFEPVRVSIGSGTGALSFQRAYLPLFQFFASDLILKSTLHKNINHLYSIIKNNHEHIFRTLKACLSEMMEARTWADTTPNLIAALQNNLDGMRLFRTLSTVLLQYFTRYRDAARNHNDVAPFVQDFADWFESWSRDVSSSPPRFADRVAQAPPNYRDLGIAHVREDVQRLQEIVQRESGAVQRIRPGPARSSLTPAQRSQAMTGQLAQTYVPPGALRPEGPRHDNDFVDIREIRIAPTHEELFSPVLPYLPVFRSDAPHHLPAGSMERLLDVQFRLLREDLISTTRSSMAAIQDDLWTIWNSKQKRVQKTKLEELLQKNGGAYRTSGYDSVFFQLYTNVEFHEQPPTAQRRGVTVTLVLDAPPAGSARDKDSKKRYDFWEHSKRLQGSSLVALVVVSNRSVRAYLGVVCSYGKDIAESAKRGKDRIQLKVAFFDADVELMALRGERLSKGASSFAVLVDNSVMYESVRPFLEKLQTIEPTDIPFSRYIAAAGAVKHVPVLPPKYARVPAFRFRLQCLAKPGKVLHDLDVLNPASVARAREELKKDSVLDPSQADAVVDTFVREVSLIQGPPGTGKSYTAKEIIRVLFASKIRPIVLIAFTNHALDHMLTSVLDAGITDKLVRLGTRSSDERISQYTLDKLEKIAATTQMDRAFKRQYATMKKLEEQMSEVMTSIRLPLVSWDTIETYLDIHYPEHADSFRMPPFWISDLSSLMWAEEEQLGEWQEAKKKSSKKKETVDGSVSRTLYGFWRAGKDLDFLQLPPAESRQSPKGKEIAPPESAYVDLESSLLTDRAAFFEVLGFGGATPPVPITNRSLSALHSCANVWGMSAPERHRLADDWEQKIRRNAYASQLQHYNALRDEYKSACKDYEDMKDENRRRLLKQSDLIACTTTGAASLTSLLASVAPKVLLVEEAGQVLEAHILASLVPSVQHLICIGDPQQLRPTLATFSLSMDSARGRELFMFDRSLMERLVDNGFQMSQINVQRRMRPTISHFIRTILYPKLEDNTLVHDYPSVQGMQKDVVFFNHLNKEGGSDDSVSKYNMFEVEMIRDLVIYFLRQGRYSGPGDIAVLCAYLGQLQKVRAALRDMKISVAVDERDAEQLALQGIDEDIDFEEVLVTRHVRLGTVDIFQGQEAKIVIVSLVRNSGQCDTGSASIGFLKSSNRINVALSRAKHGLYVMGNAANLRANATWHPCSRKCYEDCGKCEFPMYKVPLPCGHVAEKVPCWKTSLQFNAPKRSRRRSPIASISRWSIAPATPPQSSVRHLAKESPSVARNRARPFAEIVKRSTPRLRHEARRSLGPIMPLTPANAYCIVNIGAVCLVAQITSAIRSARRRAGSNAFTIVALNLVLNLVHRAWNLATGLARIFLVPYFADRSALVCLAMNPAARCCLVDIPVPPVRKLRTDITALQRGLTIIEERLADIVDFIMQRRLEEIDPQSTDVSDRLITLDCGHIFTVETLDGHCGMHDYYVIDDMGRYVRTKSPPVNYQTPPTCPTCRGPITALRYGRVTKRATLDILEQNVASTMSGSLVACNPAVEAFTTGLSEMQERAKKLPVRDLPEDTGTDSDHEQKQASAQEQGPLRASEWDLQAMQKVHGIPREEARDWHDIVKGILKTYRQVVRVATTRGAHVKAYESALTTLFRLEMQAIVNDPARATDTPEPLALAIVDQMIGQPRPKADVRFQIEAYFLSLELRALVARIAEARVEGLSTASDDADLSRHRELWASFVEFLYKSCIVDSRKAKDLASNCFVPRMEARAALSDIRFQFELFRWRKRCDQVRLSRAGIYDVAARDTLSAEVRRYKDNLSDALDSLRKEYMRKRPLESMEDLKAERGWIEDNCGRKVESWKKECDALEEFLVKGGVYQPLSLQEREDIVKALGFSHRGHFYNCENGHTFVITEVRLII
ncbi:hypothetical protein BN946_scf185042.g11 [Trametes cinnabarina]|uniref:C3H1-type domain-containing protein n=1 Tax=Pycnoporus cinnabarinus TaxID=5643 RepID=A0A060S9Y9_PYCCI|nr:hypothetical protein BN946_scf185042.g11 [Trametes cinnabarina]